MKKKGKKARKHGKNTAKMADYPVLARRCLINSGFEAIRRFKASDIDFKAVIYRSG